MKTEVPAIGAVMCRCQHCNAEVLFEAADAGQNAECPSCGLETLLYQATVPPKLPGGDWRTHRTGIFIGAACLLALLVKKLTGYPRGRPGWQIDHVVPLKRGGVDCPCKYAVAPGGRENDQGRAGVNMPARTIRAGAIRVKIYEDRSRNGKIRYEVRDQRDGRGKVKRRKLGTLAAAKAFAESVALGIQKGSTWHLRASARQMLEAERWIDLCAQFGRDPELERLAAREGWTAEAQGRLPSAPKVAEVLEEFLGEKARQQLSAYHLRDLKLRLGRFADCFRVAINQVKRADIATWLSKLSVGARTWNNYRAALAALFKFARERKYLPADWNEIEGLESIKLKRRPVKIFTAAQMEALLSACSERLLPAIALGAFAGLRSEEIQRLRWADVKWDKGYIYVREEISKTNRTRTVPITDNLADWLKPWRECQGRVCDYANLSVGKCNLARRLGLRWSRNALRQSWISYRLAATQDIARVALEAGNSPGIIHRHYLELATPAEGLKWFEIRPQTVTQNVLALKFR